MWVFIYKGAEREQGVVAAVKKSQHFYYKTDFNDLKFSYKTDISKGYTHIPTLTSLSTANKTRKLTAYLAVPY